jgi:transcriptional regulator with XRE-family HTH domain
LSAGGQIKAIRVRLGISLREFEEQSRRIADGEGSDEYFISNAWLSQIEEKDCVPSVQKLFSLAAILHLSFNEIVNIFDVDAERITRYQMTSTRRPKTHLTNVQPADVNRPVSFPIRFDRGFKASSTNLLSRVVETWGEIPIALIQHLDIRNSLYGYVGLNDTSMYPVLRPGSFVQIDQRVNKVLPFPWRSEYDRPIYFIELRDGYACSWCELHGDQLLLIPHTLSGHKIRQYQYGQEAEIVGRVTAVAMRIADPLEGPHGESARLSARS